MYVRRTIDGSNTGCSSCVGYCQYSGHPGFLTKEQRKKHNCINKECYYYSAKPQRERSNTKLQNSGSEIISYANSNNLLQEGVHFLKAIQCEYQKWKIDYITITNEYSLIPIKNAIESTFNCEVDFEQKKYSFDKCVQLIFGI